MRPYKRSSNAAGLPIVRIGRAEYVLDISLRQLRKVVEPLRVIDLREELAEVDGLG